MTPGFYITSAIIYIETLLIIFFTNASFTFGSPDIILVASFFPILLLATGKVHTAERSDKISIPFLIGHLFAFLLFAAIHYACYTVTVIPDHPIRLAAARIFSVDPLAVNIPSRLVWIASMIAICHYTLYRALFVRRLPLWPYAVCAALALALEKITMARVLRFPVWKAINMYVARTTAALLTITGYQTVCHPNPDPGVIMPFLGTDRFVVQIGTPCAGIEGATAFLIMYAALVFINRKKLNKKRALWALPLGLVIMQVTNILRIYVLVLIGHYTDSQKAVDLWHGHGSLFYYVAILMITMFLFDRWITSPPPDQK